MMRAVVVSVDYTGELTASLSRNRRHFSHVHVVTSTADAPNVRPIAEANGADVLATDLFFADGARFAKWRALEWALDAIGRRGWLCLLDADVILPSAAGDHFPRLRPGFLYGAPRRMAPWPLPQTPPETVWKTFPLHPNCLHEVAGYFQCFHADDPHLGPPPWHDVSWIHGGGADSFFCAKWRREERVYLPFEVLHLGEAGANWMGRATPRGDGSVPEDADEKRRLTREMWAARRGKSGEDRFRGEKLP